MPRAKTVISTTKIPSPAKVVTTPKPIQSVARIAKSRPHPKPKTSEYDPAPAHSATSKSSQILALLHLPQGASLAELQTATGWQAHSLRGFLSGTVRKRLGLALTVSVTETGERRYRIGEAV